MSEAESGTPLKRGWTTGACATGAARAAFEALLTGLFPDPVPVALPKGLRPEFVLATQELGADFARAGIVKDAGDDRVRKTPFQLRTLFADFISDD